MNNRQKDVKQIWKEDPTISYKNFLGLADEQTRQSVQHNKETIKILSTLFSTKKEEKSASDELKVSSRDGNFYPLSTALSSSLYCSKLIIRNINDVDFSFLFDSKIIPRIVGIDADSNLGKNINIAYRNIVPIEFSEAPQLAGPMGYHEYVIDGNHVSAKDGYLNFCVNSDINKTRIKVVIENCKGNITIIGLAEAQVSKIFENNCKKDLEFTLIPATLKVGQKSK